MAAKRADGFDGDERRKVLDGAKQVKKDLRQKKNSFGGGGVKEGKWKAQSNQLREAMANMRAISKAEKEGKPLPPAMPSGPDMSLIGCPHGAAWKSKFVVCATTHRLISIQALRAPLQPEGRRAPHPEVPVHQGQAEDSYQRLRARARPAIGDLAAARPSPRRAPLVSSVLN